MRGGRTKGGAVQKREEIGVQGQIWVCTINMYGRSIARSVGGYCVSYSTGSDHSPIRYGGCAVKASSQIKTYRCHAIPSAHISELGLGYASTQ